MKNFAAAFFDLDGTLVDNYTAIWRTFEESFLKFGFAPPTLEEVRRSVGGSVLMTAKKLLPGVPDSDVQRLCEYYMLANPKHVFDGLAELPGAAALLRALKAFAWRYRSLPTLGYTHFQPAQPVTVGKRACLWMQDLLLDLEELDAVLASMRFLGCRGTTGTEASFLGLFDGDGGKVDEMNRRLAAAFGFDRCYAVCGQTYPRKLDSRILAALSSVAQSAHRFATDVRLLQHDRQVEEPFGENQIGSSAMAYKRNPMRSERICSLARLVMAGAANAPMTASVQWFERTLDDSANRRVSLPEAFLATDAALRAMADVAGGLRVNERVVARAMMEYLPFLATENLLMEGVRRGGDRQALHEVIRRHSMAAAQRMKEGEPCDLLDRLAADPAFPLDGAQIRAMLDPVAFTGRAAEQTEAFLASLDLDAQEAAAMQPLAV